MDTLRELLFPIGLWSLLGWLTIFVGVLIATRPRTVPPGPPSDALDNCRPAVVNLLTNGWRCTTDAVAATLVDLVARGLVTIRREGSDTPRILLEIRDPVPTNLTQYERRLLSRLRAQGDGERVNLAALPFTSERAARRWYARFHAEVAADARARNVARVGVNTEFLSAATLLPGLSFGGWTYLTVPTDRLISGIAVVVMVVLVGHQLASRAQERHRPTLAGRNAAAHWLGVRTYLKQRYPELETVEFGDPETRQRTTGYAVALGLAPTVSRQLRLWPLGTRPIRFSSRTVLVRFPRRLRFCWGWGGLGCATASFGAVLAAVVTAGVLSWYGDYLPRIGEAVGWGLVAGEVAAGVILLGLGVADVVASRQRSGTVALLEPLRNGVDDGGGDRYVLAVVDGEDRDVGYADAYVLPGYLADGVTCGTRIALTVRRFTRLVSDVVITGHDRAGGAAADDGTGDNRTTERIRRTEDMRPTEDIRPTERIPTGKLREADIRPTEDIRQTDEDVTPTL